MDRNPSINKYTYVFALFIIIICYSNCRVFKFKSDASID